MKRAIFALQEILLFESLVDNQLWNLRIRSLVWNSVVVVAFTVLLEAHNYSFVLCVLTEHLNQVWELANKCFVCDVVLIEPF